MNKITIEYEYFPDLPDEARYCAWISEPEFKGTVVQGSSPADCVKEIAISLLVMELHLKSLETDTTCTEPH